MVRFGSESDLTSGHQRVFHLGLKRKGRGIEGDRWTLLGASIYQIDPLIT